LLSLWDIVPPSLVFHGEVGLVCIGGHARATAKLMSQGYMTATELATCHVSEDPTSPTLMKGYVMACVEFYERGFGVPSH
jgi:hypothetical protein